MPSIVTNEELVAELIRLRTDAGLSQRELADRARRSQSWVNKIETGQRKIDIDVASLWAQACGAELQVHMIDPAREAAGRRILETVQRFDGAAADSVVGLLGTLSSEEGRKLLPWLVEIAPLLPKMTAQHRRLMLAVAQEDAEHADSTKAEAG